MMLALSGCARTNMMAYKYCLVRDVLAENTALCEDDTQIKFPRVIEKGDKIYYTPYYENEDDFTVRGYIKRIDR